MELIERISVDNGIGYGIKANSYEEAKAMALKLYAVDKEIFALIEEMKMETAGFGNGHDQFAIINVDGEKVARFIAEKQINSGEDEDFCGLICDLAYDENGATFDTHAIRFETPGGDLLKDISVAFPDAVCMWSDCWDDLVFDVMKNGKPYKQYHITVDEIGESDEDEYIAFEVSICCDNYEARIHMGSGMVHKAEVSDFVTANRSKIRKIKTVEKQLSELGVRL